MSNSVILLACIGLGIAVFVVLWGGYYYIKFYLPEKRYKEAHKQYIESQEKLSKSLEKAPKEVQELISSIEQSLTSNQNTTLDVLLTRHDSLEIEWNEWNEKWANKVARKKDSSVEKRKRDQVASEIKRIRASIKDSFPDVITDIEALKQKAYLLATSSEKSEMNALESELNSVYHSLKASGIAGGQLLENTHSSVLRGVAASTLVGPVAGGITYAVTEAENKAITNSNATKRVQNAVFSSIGDNAQEIQNQSIALYTEIIHNHDKDVHIHIYKIKYL